MSAAAGPAALEGSIGYEFSDRSLLGTALTHSSWSAENDGVVSNQRLEFLGDAVLDLIVAHWLYDEHGELSEGQMSKARAAVVNRDTLADSGRACSLGSQLLLGQGEVVCGGRGNPSMLADAVEAVIGAVYLDGGLAAAVAVVRRLLKRPLRDAVLDPGDTDFKSRLQEMAASAGLERPQYEVTDSGPEHDKRFHALVSAGGAIGAGEGSTKKDASQRAAEVACTALSAHLAQDRQ